jgi:uncharacterized protein (DUF2147 family)
MAARLHANSKLGQKYDAHHVPECAMKDGDEYVGGEILDPDNGKVYRSKVRLIDDGKKLSVRGYIGVPALGRSQTWVRQE